MLYCIVLYYTVLYYIVLYCSILYYILLCYIFDYTVKHIVYHTIYYILSYFNIYYRLLSWVACSVARSSLSRRAPGDSPLDSLRHRRFSCRRTHFPICLSYQVESYTEAPRIVCRSRRNDKQQVSRVVGRFLRWGQACGHPPARVGPCGSRRRARAILIFWQASGDNCGEIH